MFFKPKLHKESKNGFRTINCFWSNKIIKKIGCFVDFCIFMAIYMDKLDQFKNVIAGYTESVEILPKC